MADKAGGGRDARTWLRRLRSRINYRNETEDFEARSKGIKSVDAVETLGAAQVSTMGDEEFTRRFQAAVAQSGRSVAVNLFPIHLQWLLSSVEAHYFDVVVEGDRQTALSINGSRFRSLTLNNVATITLADCRIGRLGASGAKPNYFIRDCMIGEFDVHEGSPVQRLEWDGGYLGQFHLHEEHDRAFVGDVWLHDLALPKNPEHHGVQWLRDAREALNARSNFVAAGVFHASELALSRDREPFINRVASRVYQAFSNYGNSLGLPIIWFVLSLLAIGVLASIVGTVLITDPASGPPSGWHAALRGDGLQAQALRAAIYALQSVFNPLNLIVPKPLVSVSHWGAAFASFILGIFGIISFALFLLSLRRRFKLE